MNIFFRELKSNLRSLLIWGSIVILFVVIGFSKFSAYEGNPELVAILDELPPAMLSAFNFDAFNLTTITGFLGVMFTYFGLVLSIAAAMWGSDIITKEERDKTVEFSLTLPVTRSRVVTAKIFAALVNCIALLLITWGAAIVGAMQYQPDSEFYNFLKQYKRASSAAVAVLLGTYFMSIISGLNENLEFLKFFSPFKYFNPATLLHESTIDLTFILLSAGIVAVLIVGAYVSYSRRDLYI